MHQLIHGLVYETEAEAAVDAASVDIFEPLVDSREFDYFVTFDGSEGRSGSGGDRWSDLPAAVRADTEKGEELIERGWEATVNEYERSFDRIEEFFEQHDVEEFWSDQEVHCEYSLAFNRVGEFAGSGTFLYDEDGQGIRDRGHLERVENEWGDGYGSVQHEDLELYVVPADVHY